MHQPPNDGDHPSNPDGGTERPHGRPPPHPRLPRSPGTGTPGVIAFAGFLAGGMVGICGSGPAPTAAPATGAVTRLTASSGSPARPSEPSEEDVMPMVERGFGAAWTRGQPVRRAPAPRLHKTSAGTPQAGGRGPPRRPTRTSPAGAASPAVGQPPSGGSRP